jgi:hypothetical protein
VIRLRFISSAFFARPALIISHAAADARAISSSTCGSSCNVFLRGSSARVGMRLEIQLPTALVGYVGVELRGREIGMSEHFLNRSQIGSPLEEVGGERVPEQVRMDTMGIEARFLGEFAEDQEGAGPCQGPASGVQEQLRPVPRVEERAAAREVTQKCLGGVPADRNDALLAALADHSNEAVVEVDAGLLEPDRL